MRSAGAALNKAREALEQVKAALGDRLLGNGPLSKPYAHGVMRQIDDALAALRPSVLRSPRRAADVWCGDCDGCGWFEGGPTLKTPCTKCGGTGRVPARPKAPPRTTGKAGSR